MEGHPCIPGKSALEASPNLISLYTVRQARHILPWCHPLITLIIAPRGGLRLGTMPQLSRSFYRMRGSTDASIMAATAESFPPVAIFSATSERSRAPRLNRSATDAEPTSQGKQHAMDTCCMTNAKRGAHLIIRTTMSQPLCFGWVFGMYTNETKA